MKEINRRGFMGMIAGGAGAAAVAPVRAAADGVKAACACADGAAECARAAGGARGGAVNPALPRVVHEADFCVVGGGLAGTIAAISAARRGAKVVLVQDRPVLGGNASSEVRMWVRGAGGLNRESGVLTEFEEENIYRNATLSAPVWDTVLYGKVMAEKNITLLLNTSCVDARAEGGLVKEITAWQLNTYTWHTVRAKIFADCSGDSILAPLVGASFRVGREAKSEHGESLGRDVADAKTMGSSILLQARETDHEVPFIPPAWAYTYKTDAEFAAAKRQVSREKVITESRNHDTTTNGCNLWWIEIGGEEDTIRDADKHRDELLKIAFGIWDHIKNQGDHGKKNWELEWIGALPGKRESRRYVGAKVMTENDIVAGGKFDDVIAYGGWPMDDHNPKGFYGHSPSKLVPAPLYGIPFRTLYSDELKNLMFAGRNISVTHTALSSTRVMGTCSLLGQACGTAAALCVEKGILPGGLIAAGHTRLLQQRLMDDGVFLPGVTRGISEATKGATVNLDAAARAVLFNGVERPRPKKAANFVSLAVGARLSFTFAEKTALGALRIQFDRDWSRKSITPNIKMQTFAQRLHTGKDFVPVKVANTIVKRFKVFADGALVHEAAGNYDSLVKIPLNLSASKIEIEFAETWGADRVNLFACDFIG